MATNKGISKIIISSSIGTLIEWYDFYIFGSLSILISNHLFPNDSDTSALLKTLALFAAGFIVRPFGALVFGNIGDKIGRKYTFLLTLILMGISTFAIGLIPDYNTIGIFAPILVLLFRLIQGLALGGEYGGAATYVAEHAPEGKRGLYTSWIQTTATLGLMLSLGVILVTKSFISAAQWQDWGWRIPFLISIVLVIVSIYIRLNMNESPLFEELKVSGKVSKNPIKESFTKKENLKLVLLALFGAVMGQGVVWYTGQFYAQNFIEQVCLVNFEQSKKMMLIAIVLATPLFIFFGWWSDKIGRKWIMLCGLFLAIICYMPINSKIIKLTEFKNDIAIEHLKTISTETSETTEIKTNKETYYNGIQVETKETRYLTQDKKTEIKQQIFLDSYRTKWIVFLIWIQICFVTMVYGPIAAFLVELFPTHIRYTSMSLPYHIGNGIFGGLTPFMSTLIMSYQVSEQYPKGNPLSGLYYPIGISILCLLIGLFFLPGNKANLKKYFQYFKKIIALICIIIGISAIALMLYFAYKNMIIHQQKNHEILEWAIILIVFIPQCIGLILFGYFGIKDEYNSAKHQIALNGD